MLQRENDFLSLLDANPRIPNAKIASDEGSDTLTELSIT